MRMKGSMPGGTVLKTENPWLERLVERFSLSWSIIRALITSTGACQRHVVSSSEVSMRELETWGIFS